MFKIDTDIPPPGPDARANGPTRPAGAFLQTCQALKPGHSFTVRGEKPNHVSGRLGIAAVRTGFTFTQRKTGDEIRIWRTS
jgi:hypothetical protein